MNAEGTAYVLQWKHESTPSFITTSDVVKLKSKNITMQSPWATLYISGGRKDKISKGDLAGLFFKQGKLKGDEVGVIELKQDCAFVAVPKHKVASVIEKTNNTRLKKKKVRVTLLR